MKKIMFLLFFIVSMFSFVFAQSPFAEFDKVKEIKLLESTRDDVIRILADYKFDFSDDERYYQWFSTKNAHIKISYSKGRCSGRSEYWNVPEWVVTDIDVSPKNSIKIQDIGIDYSKYRKERLYANEPRSYVYHKKELGIAFEVIENEIKTIYLFPSKIDYTLLCNNESARKFHLSKKWFIDSNLEERYIDYNYHADVVNLILSSTEITASCNTLDAVQNRTCSDSNHKIAVLISAKDPENDVLTYDYKVSGGKIIGRGSNVVWDLSGVKPGTYTITAGVDDGCGICGKTMTKTVVVKDCPDCQ